MTADAQLRIVYMKSGNHILYKQTSCFYEMIESVLPDDQMSGSYNHIGHMKPFITVCLDFTVFALIKYLSRYTYSDQK